MLYISAIGFLDAIEDQLEFRKKMVIKILTKQYVRVSSNAFSSAKLK